MTPRIHRKTEAAAPRSAGLDGGPLTRREHEVLCALAGGETYAAISARLGVSPLTLKNHVYNVHRKLDVSSLIAAYARLGWLRCPDKEEP